MFKRWAIRSVFLFPLLLCVLGWGWSVGYEGIVGYSHGGYSVAGYTRWGVAYLICGIYTSIPSGGVWEANTQNFCIIENWPDGMGFRCKQNINMPLYREWIVGVPYWFLILIFSLTLFIVWRKTRPKLSPATAFPVETTKGAS